MRTALIVLALTVTPVPALADDCASLVDEAEATQGQAAVAAAKRAVSVCKLANIKTARPYMVLAVQANQNGKFNEVITWSKQGLQQEPGLPLAYMNICAAEMQLKKYDDAVQSCKDGLKKPNGWSAKLNFNIGLSLFKKAVEAQKFPEALKSEPYFIESKRLDPSIAQNDFYLGILEENVKSNPQAALAHYEPACRGGYQPSCEAISRMKIAPSPSASVTVPPAASPEEATLWDAIETAYRNKGLDAATARQTVENIRGGMATVPAEQRLQALKTMLDALK